MTELYDRQARVVINGLRLETTHKGANGMPYGGVRIAFKVELSVKENTASAEIFNLSEDSRGRIDAKFPQLVIEAGYGDDIATMFKGDTVMFEHSKERVDWRTKIEAVDGYVVKRKKLDVSIAPGATIGDVVEIICGRAGLPGAKAIRDAKAGRFNTKELKSFPNGYTLSGTVDQAIGKLAHALGVDCSIQQGELMMLRPSQESVEQAVILAEGTGLIGAPKRVQDKKHPKAIIIQARSLLQAKLSPGRRVLLTSKSLSGSYRVSKVTHSGDSRGGDWFSDVEAIAV